MLPLFKCINKALLLAVVFSSFVFAQPFNVSITRYSGIAFDNGYLQFTFDGSEVPGLWVLYAGETRPVYGSF